MAYHTLTTDFNHVPMLGTLPQSVDEGLKTYDLSKLVPDNTTEILVYAFITVTGSPDSCGKLTRSAYEFFTEDSNGEHYSQVMNVAFTPSESSATSANMWFPIFQKREFNARLPQEWSAQLSRGLQDRGIAQAQRSWKEKEHANLREAMKAYTSGQQGVFADVFLLGYRTSDGKKLLKK